MINVNYFDNVVVVELNRSTTNALNPGLVQRLAAILHNVEADPKVQALVLTSANDKFFSIGFDIPELYQLSKEEFETFYRNINQTCMALYTLPKPTVAAITGHAIAGGCILALCCDYRLIGDGRKLVGLNEIKLGVPVPYLADCILQSLVGTRRTQEVVEMGEFYEAQEALEMGLVDKVLPLGELLEKSIELARLLGLKPPGAYRIMKQNRVEGIEERILAHWEEKQRYFIECWYSDEARERLKKAMEKF